MSVSAVSYVPFDASQISGGGGAAADTSKIIDDQTSFMYIGTAVPGTATSAASWKIKKVVIAGAVTTIYYAGGSATATNIWDNRAALSYS